MERESLLESVDSTGKYRSGYSSEEVIPDAVHARLGGNNNLARHIDAKDLDFAKSLPANTSALAQTAKALNRVGMIGAGLQIHDAAGAIIAAERDGKLSEREKRKIVVTEVAETTAGIGGSMAAGALATAAVGLFFTGPVGWAGLAAGVVGGLLGGVGSTMAVDNIVERSFA